MAIRPEEATQLSPEEKSMISDLEKGIDAEIQENYVNARQTMTYSIPKGTPKRVINNVQELYVNAGWYVEICHDQRDGDWFTFKPRGAKY